MATVYTLLMLVAYSRTAFASYSQVTFRHDDHYHNVSDYVAHLGSLRGRWYVYRNEPIPVAQMRSDCLGRNIRVINVDLVVPGAVCAKEGSAAYISELVRQVESCGSNAQCQDVEWDHNRMSRTDCSKRIHSFASLCNGYLQQYARLCHQFFTGGLFSFDIRAIDLEFECTWDDQPPSNDTAELVADRFAVLTLTHLADAQPAIFRDVCTRENASVRIFGAVEASDGCPADKSAYQKPQAHPLVQEIQKRINQKSWKTADFQNYLHLRVICGNLVFPVVQDGILPAFYAHVWVYFRCQPEEFVQANASQPRDDNGTASTMEEEEQADDDGYGNNQHERTATSMSDTPSERPTQQALKTTARDKHSAKPTPDDDTDDENDDDHYDALGVRYPLLYRSPGGNRGFSTIKLMLILAGAIMVSAGLFGLAGMAWCRLIRNFGRTGRRSAQTESTVALTGGDLVTNVEDDATATVTETHIGITV